MPDLMTDLTPTQTPPAAGSGSLPDLTCGMPAHGEPARDLVAPKGEVQRLITAALDLFSSLLSGIVGSSKIGLVVKELLMLALREALRPRSKDSTTAPPEKEETPLPVAPEPSALAREVRRAIERHATGAVGQDVVQRATMGVEFVAGIEADQPGSIEAFGNG